MPDLGAIWTQRWNASRRFRSNVRLVYFRTDPGLADARMLVNHLYCVRRSAVVSAGPHHFVDHDQQVARTGVDVWRIAQSSARLCLTIGEALSWG